jgi:ribosomal-protein-alanine N-acetyltransferase
VVDAETVFETTRLWLEPLRGSHAAEMFDWLCDQRLYRFVPQDPPAGVAALAETFGRLETRRSPCGDQQWLNWVARAKGDSVCIGQIQATVNSDASAYLAYEIAPAHWGRGLASEACQRIVRAIFEEFGASRILAEVDTRNAASIRLLGRLGFRRTAFRSSADFFKGSASDEFTYALDKPADANGPGG